MWIKICGVTRSEDVSMVVNSGADAIGINFFPGSKRFVSLAAARMLANAARPAEFPALPVDLVGVFVNADAKTVRRTVQDVGLNVIQIHGDETDEQIAEIHHLCPDTPIIRAFRVDPQDMERTLNDVDRLSRIVPLAAALLDAFVPGVFGGTGITVDPVILQQYAMRQRPRLILSGGLNPDNVASLADHAAVWGIDTASGVESSAGIKDAARVSRFINAARALETVTGGLTRSVRM